MFQVVRIKQILAAIMLCLLTAFGFTADAQAGPQQASSTNYGVSEVNFGSGGDVHICSTSYCSKQSAGELTVGNTASSAYQAQAGFNTNREELLEVSVPGPAIALGVLNASAVSYGSSTFSVKAYLASGYVVIVGGSAPTDASGGGSHTLPAMTSADISRPGTEQFGINLRQNTSPAVGANPQLVPDNTFSYGTAATGYDTPDNFKFAAGDTIAQSLSSSGTTMFTLSAIENIASNTPAGSYRTNLTVNVMPSF